MKTKNKARGKSLWTCIKIVMEKPGVVKRYPRGMNSSEILKELNRYGYRFPWVTVIDVANEMERWHS